MSVVTARSVVQVFAALGDPQRQQLLEALAQRPGGASASTLAVPLPVSRQAVDKHLRVLRRAGLVVSSRNGREVRYVVQPQELQRSAAWLTAMAERWDQRLAAIKVAAESGKVAGGEPGSSTTAEGST